MRDCDIFIDTNQVLHFKPIDQIDWCSLTGATQCTLVIAPILLRELEQKKIFGPSPSLKARAGRMIDFLVEKMGLDDPIALRANVTLAFAEHEPGIDFSAHQLVREVNDDQYIASAIERQQAGGRSTFIASNDGGMALKVRSRPIAILRLPDELKLPADVDAEQKELRDAKRELALLKNSRPKLQLRFSEGGIVRAVRNARSLKSDLASLESVRRDHPLLPTPTAEDAPFDGDIASIGDFALRGFGSVGRIEDYNAALPDYFAQYERYLTEHALWLEQLRLTTTVGLTLHNDGSATSTNVDVIVRFPETITLRRQRDWTREPHAPEAPRKPGTRNILDSYFGAGSLPRPYDLLGAHLVVNDQAPYIDRDNPHTVEFHVRSLKQKCVIEFDQFLLTRDSGLGGKGAEAEVTITFNEGEPVLHKLAITFEEVDPRDSDD